MIYLSEFQLALLIGALFTLAISYRLPRAWLWIGAGALSFVASTAYARHGLPQFHEYIPPTFFTLACDAAICLFVYAKAREEWELRIFDVFRLSVLISTFRLFGVIETHWLYVVCLELLNWSALLLIGGTGILARMAGEHNPFDPWLTRLRRLRLSLRSARQSAPWFQVSGK